ncbi:MAG: hypothetical protein J3R72DRAFT_466113 [Linnemannia gamsii]|nr:MAG: hypothetical protein J3R72DRAFT_466113 [Linnemannia gamsii]
MHHYSLCALLFCLLTVSNIFYTSFCCGLCCALSVKHFLRSIVFVVFKAKQHAFVYSLPPELRSRTAADLFHRTS